MNFTNNIPKIFSGLWCGQRKRPGAYTRNSVGHLKAAFLFNFLKITCYEPVNTDCVSI